MNGNWSREPSLTSFHCWFLNLSLHQHSLECGDLDILGCTCCSDSVALGVGLGNQHWSTLLVMLLNLGDGSELVISGQSKAEYSRPPQAWGELEELGLLFLSPYFLPHCSGSLSHWKSDLGSRSQRVDLINMPYLFTYYYVRPWALGVGGYLWIQWTNSEVESDDTILFSRGVRSWQALRKSFQLIY